MIWMHDDIVEVWITPKNNSNKVEMRIFYTENNMVQVEKFNMKPEKALIVTYDAKGQIFCQKKEL